MDNKIKLREEIDDKYKWDLTTIYENDKKWEEDFKKAEKLLEKIPAYKDIFIKSSDNLLDFLSFDESLDRLINKLYYFFLLQMLDYLNPHEDAHIHMYLHYILPLL